MFKELVYYMEACESGSMFVGFPTNLKIYAVTAANPTESSWGCYCPPDDVVMGKHINSCLGDLFSVNWMEDMDKANCSETLA
jgi:legumain